eukprot:scaffold106943_cov31-Tisochrysis_lutea.AAC.2
MSSVETCEVLLHMSFEVVVLEGPLVRAEVVQVDECESLTRVVEAFRVFKQGGPHARELDEMAPAV